MTQMTKCFSLICILLVCNLKLPANNQLYESCFALNSAEESYNLEKLCLLNINDIHADAQSLNCKMVQSKAYDEKLPESKSGQLMQDEILQQLIEDMVYIQGGTFTMGCSNEDICNYGEKPAHSVELSDFYIGKYEVTQLQWELVMGINPSVFYKCYSCPVEYVNWHDVQKFISKLNLLTGRNFRLPTESEWEYAARGGVKNNSFQYAGGNIIDSLAWYYENNNGKTHPVGEKEPNELGLYDMSGNVFEWCSDWYGAYTSADKTNPSGSSEGTERVARGGCWGSDSIFCTVSARHSFSSDNRNNSLGFRLALTP